MKQSRFTVRLISAAAAVLFVCSAAVPVYAESDANSWLNPIESQTDATEPDPEEEDPEEPEDPEPEETAPAAVLDPDFTTNEPEDSEESEDPEEPGDSDDPEPSATTAAPVTTAAPALPAASYTPEAEHTMYAPQVINIRSGPGTDYDKLGVLYANSEITVIGNSGEWAAVSYNGSTGYILRSLLSSTPPTTTTPAPETAPPQSEETSPAEESLPPATEPTESEWKTPEPLEPVETTAPPVKPKETTTREPAPAASAQPTDGGGLSPFLIALLSAAAAFLLIGVLPVFIHRVHHKNLYRY